MNPFASSIFSTLFFLTCFAQENVRFIHLKHKVETQNYQTVAMAQDTTGRVWISDLKNIRKYNGYSFSIISYGTIFDINKEETDAIHQIVKDSMGTIWFVSDNGYISRTDRKGSIKPLSVKGEMFNGFKINYLLPTKSENWLSTGKGKILRYNLADKTLEKVVDLPPYVYDISGKCALVYRNPNELYIYTNLGHLFVYYIDSKKLVEINVKREYKLFFKPLMVMDKKDRLWLNTISPNYGLLVYDPKQMDFVETKIFDQNTLDKTKQTYKALTCDSRGNIWAGTDGNGLYEIDSEVATLKTYNYNIYNDLPSSNYTVVGVFEDRLQNLWIANNFGDIKIRLNSASTLIKHQIIPIDNVFEPEITAIRENNGTLWLGTNGNGLIEISPQGKTNIETIHLANEETSKGFYIVSFAEDGSDALWIATKMNGLWVFNKKTKEVFKFPMIDPTENITARITFAVFKDSKNRIWVGTESGLFLYNTDRNLSVVFNKIDLGLQQEAYCRSIIEAPDGVIWLGTSQGLFRFTENPNNLKNSSLKRIPFFDEQNENLDNLVITDLSCDDNGNVWIVNSKGNCYSFNDKKSSYKSYANIPDFKDIAFNAVEVQDSKNIWLSSDNGIWHINSESNLFKPYFKADGFFGNSFLKSSYRDKEGNLYFGIEKGVNYFNPKALLKRSANAKLYIEKIEILNKPADSVIPDQIATTHSKIDNLKLKHSQSSFSIDYVAIDDVLTPNFQYAYRLKGFNDTWTESNNQLKASYINVPYGSYEFQVKAGSYEKTWDIGQKSIKINISPPFYKSFWAKLFYVLFGLSLVYMFFRWIKLNNKLAIEKQKHQKDKEIYDLKVNFFAKVSHQIQTPLTLILIPIENMLMRAKDSGNELLRQQLKMISDNAKRLSRVVSELTTIRDKELDKLKLRVSKNNIIKNLQKIERSFIEQAKLKNINFNSSFPDKKIRIWYDKDKIEHVFYNLLSNAIKFTPKNGNISILVEEDSKNELVEITIKNSGSNIPKEELNHIFELFYQVDTNKKNMGMGIGLALTKELVDLHHGSVEVASNVKEGTSFIVKLPTREDIFSDAEKLQLTHDEELLDNIKTYFQNAQMQEIPSDFDKVILIVEDNFELLDYLCKTFENYYTVIQASDGEEGYTMAKKHVPNLILSDVKMPEVDGVEMSEMLQKNIATAHIPIILLTAYENQVSKISALRAGVIEYITKPFKVNELLLKAHNIISRSDRLKSKFKTDLIGTPNHPTVKSTDETFLEKLVELVEERMSNPDFKVDDLSENLNMSYSAIFRKFQSLTGKTIVDFVRSMRIKKASMYLVESNYTVSQAAYAVGFNDPKYFSKCFKNEFGLTPNNYKKHHIKKPY